MQPQANQKASTWLESAALAAEPEGGEARASDAIKAPGRCSVLLAPVVWPRSKKRQGGFTAKRAKLLFLRGAFRSAAAFGAKKCAL
jgi:hypothetical protein